MSQIFAFLQVFGYDSVVRWLLGVIGGDFEVIDFSGVQFPKSAILYAVFFYVRHAVSYRDLDEIMAERGLWVAMRR